MVKAIILTHGDLAVSLYNTLGLFISRREGLKALGMDADMEGFTNKVREEILESPEEEILVMVDLFGGTPFNIAASMLSAARDRGKRVEIISGVNLPMLLDVTANIPESSLDELKKTAFDMGKYGIRDLMAELRSKEVK